MPVLEVPKRLPKPKGLRASERPKNDGHRIELPIAAEVLECQTGKRQAPSLALRQFNTTALPPSLGRMFCSMYTCHTGLSEYTKRMSRPLRHHHVQMTACRLMLATAKKTSVTANSTEQPRQQWDHQGDMPPCRTAGCLRFPHEE